MLSLASCLVVFCVAIPVFFLALECWAAIFARRHQVPFDITRRKRPSICVLIPAHDEEGLIGAAIKSAQGDLTDNDRLLVVAHNCNDATASQARLAGAEVYEVKDDGAQGKPGALNAGINYLAANPPEVVVILDADCQVVPSSIVRLACAASELNTPVQGKYLFSQGGEGFFSYVSSLAVLVKNLVRPLGLTQMKLPCLINGSGSAIPFELLREVPLKVGSISEDFQLTIDLALIGFPTSFCPQAEIYSDLPRNKEVAYNQRKRWEHGHLQLLIHSAPRLLLRGLSTKNIGLCTLALELYIPPLSFLVLWWFASCLLSLVSVVLGGHSLPLLLGMAIGLLLFGSILSAVARFAGVGQALQLLSSVPKYITWKVPLYFSYLLRREKRWHKTVRD